jgi:hypothetical protein
MAKLAGIMAYSLTFQDFVKESSVILHLISEALSHVIEKVQKVLFNTSSFFCKPMIHAN